MQWLKAKSNYLQRRKSFKGAKRTFLQHTRGISMLPTVIIELISLIDVIITSKLFSIITFDKIIKGKIKFH